MEAEVVQGPGVASVRCGEPASQIWFVGPGPRNGAAQIKLDLMNIDSLTANVDVTIITDAGPVQAGNATGITVPPRHTVTDSLSAGAAGSTVVAVEVRTTIGRVAADVSVAVSGGAASWLPSTVAPATRLVIPGVPPSGRSAGLFLVVPGGSNARVSVLAITPQGQYRPFGSQTVDLPGESASYVALAPLGGTAAALEITANVPVTAAVLVPGSGAGAFATATAPVSEQAVVAGNVTGSGFAASVALSAPAGAARVRLTEIAPAAGAAASRAAATSQPATASQTVSVRAGHTLVVPATAPRGAKRGSAFSVVITPLAGSGPLYAARVETQGQGTVVSIIPAISALTAISLPPVRDAYDAIVPPNLPISVAVARIDRLGIDPEYLGELLDHHVEDELAQFLLILGPRQQRPPEQDDARSRGRVPGVAGVRRAADDAGQRHSVLAHGVGVRDFLDRELHVGKLGFPARLQPRHRFEHEIIELLRPAAVQRDPGRHQPAA
jgi:hypothetical protein